LACEDEKYYDCFISYIEQIETQFDWFHNVVFGNHECKDLDVALHKLIIFLFYLLFCIGNERFVCGVLRVALDEDDSKGFSRTPSAYICTASKL